VDCPGRSNPQASPRVRSTAGLSPHSRQAQVAGPSLRGGSPRSDGSARPGVPLSQGSRPNSSPRARWRQNELSGSGAAGTHPQPRFAQTGLISRPVRAKRAQSPGLRGPSSGLSHWRSPPTFCLHQPAGGPAPPTSRGSQHAGCSFQALGMREERPGGRAR
jgi:hypothetical protein